MSFRHFRDLLGCLGILIRLTNVRAVVDVALEVGTLSFELESLWSKSPVLVPGASGLLSCGSGFLNPRSTIGILRRRFLWHDVTLVSG
jgi:hypothetical protein